MDNRAQIREFLASRRARITPEQAGLPAYGSNRRVAGLRREEVAMLAGVSIDYYVRMERGNLAGASDAVLEGIARALQLDDAERGHLFDLARGSEPPAGPAAPDQRRTTDPGPGRHAPSPGRRSSEGPLVRTQLRPLPAGSHASVGPISSACYYVEAQRRSNGRIVIQSSCVYACSPV
jgi:transcriptional regulator with XRE-family HTH domain